MADNSYSPESGGAFAAENVRQQNNTTENGYDSDDEEYMFGNQEGGGGNEEGGNDEDGDEVDDSEQERDYYAILNVPKDATDAQLRQSYRQLSLHFHPDKQPPHLRTQATSKFNLIQKAYETLMDPHKRIIYDTLGEKGLSMKGLEVGTKTMSNEEFRYYIEEKIRRSQREALEREVGFHSTLVMGVDGRSWFGFDQEVIEGPDGELIPVPFSDQVGLLSRVFLQHGFHVPMKLLRQIINEPVSVRRVYEDVKAFIPGTTVRGKSDTEWDEEQAREQALEHLPAPLLRLSGSLGGQTIPTVSQDAKGRRTKVSSAVVAQAGLEVSLVHGFPAVPPTQPRTAAGLEKGWMDKETSIARLMADSQISLSHQILARTSTISYTRPILGRTAGLQMTGQFYHAIKRQYSMPMVEAMFTRQVTRRGTFFVAFSSGTKWGLNLPFGIGKWGVNGDWWGNSSSRVGFSYMGGSGMSPTIDDEFDEEEGEQGGGGTNGSSDQRGNGNSSDNNSNKEKRDRAANRQKSRRNTQATVYMTANRIPPSAAALVTVGLEISRNFLTLPRPKSLPPSVPLPNSHRGIRARLKSSVNLLGTLSLSLSFTRAISTHSHLGLSLSIEPSDSGVVFGIIFRRLGQKFHIPILMTKFMDAEDLIYRSFRIWGLGVMTVATGWWIWESSVVRPWERRMRRLRKVKAQRALKERIERGMREAEDAVDLMREGVQRKIDKERECDGLVILEATYGLPEETGVISGIVSWIRKPEQNIIEAAGRPRRIDVTIAVANLVDNSQLVIPAKLVKSQLPGFYNPFPGQLKTLKITYLFRGIRHGIEVEDPRGVVCPHRGHVIGDLPAGQM